MAGYSLAKSEEISATTRVLSADLQRVVHVLCDTYEALDLRIETTLGAAEADFLGAMPEIKNHESDMRLLVRHLLSDVRATADAAHEPNQPVFLRFAFQDEGDLVEQLLSGARAHVIVVPVDGDISLHRNIQGVNI